MFDFDEDKLSFRLKKFRPISRMLFAVTCAQRLFPVYEFCCDKVRFSTAIKVRSALANLWKLVLKNETKYEGRFLDLYDDLIPSEDSQWSPLNPIIENAVAAVAYACQSADAENAAWAALQCYEATDYVVHTIEKIKFSSPLAESQILGSELVQAELLRQNRDLKELNGIPPSSTEFMKVAAALRARAKAEGTELVRFVGHIYNQGRERKVASASKSNPAMRKTTKKKKKGKSVGGN